MIKNYNFLFLFASLITIAVKDNYKIMLRKLPKRYWQQPVNAWNDDEKMSSEVGRYNYSMPLLKWLICTETFHAKIFIEIRTFHINYASSLFNSMNSFIQNNTSVAIKSKALNTKCWSIFLTILYMLQIHAIKVKNWMEYHLGQTLKKN